MTRFGLAGQYLRSLWRRMISAMPRWTRKRFPRRLLVVLTILATVAAGMYSLRSPILTAMARLLWVEDSLKQADFIFVLNGGVHVRPFRAAELYRRTLAPEIIIARAAMGPAEKLGLYPNETDVAVQVLQHLGYPGPPFKCWNLLGM